MSLTSRRPGPTTRLRVRDEAPGVQDRHRADHVITEEPLEIRGVWDGVQARPLWTTMRTPGNDFELAAGWAVHEGVATPGSIRKVAYCENGSVALGQEFNVVTVTMSQAPRSVPHQHSAVTAGSSACGVCGSDSLNRALTARAPRWSGALPEPDVIRGLPEILRAQQRLFGRTGGVHAAALMTHLGAPLVVREDVGRHNAVDKVTGARVLAGKSVAEACLVVSGRVGFELVQKALAAGVGSMVAVGAPTSLAVDLARSAGLALHGFARPDRAVRYA